MASLVLSLSLLTIVAFLAAIAALKLTTILGDVVTRRRWRTTSSACRRRNPPDAALVPFPAAQNTQPQALALRQIYRDFFIDGEWESTIERFAALLPKLVREQAPLSERHISDIIKDLIYSSLRALAVDFKDLAELRQDQASDKYDVVWVAAYPFLDLLDKEEGGFYQPTRRKLNQGHRFVFFQFDRRYFDELKSRLGNDPERNSNVCLDEADDSCQLRFVTCPSTFFPVAMNVSLWNPGRTDMVGFVNDGDPIAISRTVAGEWKLQSPVVMRKIGDQVSLNKLYEDLDGLLRRSNISSGRVAGVVPLPLPGNRER